MSNDVGVGALGPGRQDENTSDVSKICPLRLSTCQKGLKGQGLREAEAGTQLLPNNRRLTHLSQSDYSDCDYDAPGDYDAQCSCGQCIGLVPTWGMWPGTGPVATKPLFISLCDQPLDPYKVYLDLKSAAKSKCVTWFSRVCGPGAIRAKKRIRSEDIKLLGFPFILAPFPLPPLVRAY